MSVCALEVQSVHKRFGGVVALSDFSCSLRQGHILGLIGPNGAGKTTLLNVINGFVSPDRGGVRLNGREITGTPPHARANLGVGRTFQDLRIIRQLSVLDNALLCFRKQLGEQLANVFLRWHVAEQQESTNRAEAMGLLGEVGLSEKADALADELSYGQQKLLSLVCCLAAGAELLLLDEPVAGVAPEMITKVLGIIRGLAANGKAILLIEHNLDAVTRVCDRLIFMDAGTKVTEGPPEEVRSDPRVIETYIG